MTIILISKDPSLLDRTSASYQRHVAYANTLSAQAPSEDLLVLLYVSYKLSTTSNLSSSSCRLQVVPVRYKALRPLYILVSLTRLLLNSNYSLISAQEPWEEGLVSLLLTKLFNIPLHLQLHLDIFSPAWLLESPLNLFKLLFSIMPLMLARRIRCVSANQPQALHKYLKISPKRIDICPVLVDRVFYERDSPFLNHNYSAQPESFHFVYACRFVPGKGIEKFLSLLPSLETYFPNSRYTIAGSGPLYKETVSLVQNISSNLKERIFLPGQLNQRQLCRLYTESDVFLCTSQYEGFCRSVLEAQLCGLPVVTTPCGGPETIIQPDITGVIAKSHSCLDIVNACLDLCLDVKKLSRFASNSYLNSRSHFSQESLLTSIVNSWRMSLPTPR